MSGYIGPDPNKMRDTQSRVSYSAANGQNTFAAEYTPGFIDVYQNGLKLSPTIDFTATNGTSIVLTTPASLSDAIEIVSITASSPYNFYTKAQSDLKGSFYGVAAGTGDTMTVTLTPTPTSLVDGMEIKIRTVGPNTIAAPSLTIMGLGVSKTIFTAGGQALTAGTYVANQEITLRYNLTADRFELVAGALLYAPTQVVGDISNRLATTGWVNSAIATIATAAGFAVSLGANGYVKLPSWLGGVVIQWGNTSAGQNGGVVWTNFPLQFPTAVGSVVANHLGADASVNVIIDSSLNTVTFGARSNYVAGPVSIFWIAIGY